MNLDDVQAVARLDSQDMLEHVSELPQQVRDAWDHVQGLDLPPLKTPTDHLVVAGMGGSAIGGALLQGLVADTCPASITVVRDYTLPAFAAGPRTLVAACSYSGNTEETLSCFDQALERDSRVVAITTGGKLAARAREVDVPVVRFDYQAQPRAALGHAFILLLGTIHRLGLVNDYTNHIAEAAAVMEAWQQEIHVERPTTDNAAKKLARRLEGTLPIAYGAGFLAAVARRWKTQFNENAKSWAFFETLPELDHNAVVGLGIPDVIREHATVLMLRSSLDLRRITERWDVTGEVLAREGVTTREIWGRGESELAQILSLIHFGDYVSFYLAMLNQVDPTPIETIAFLKQRLAELGSVAG